MDFTPSEEVRAVQQLARQIFTDRVTAERLREVETSASRVDEELWAELGKAGLLGLALPEEYGGAGLELDAFAMVLEEQGRTVAPVPLWSAGVAALAVAAYGTGEQQGRWLSGCADGTTRIALALEEWAPAVPSSPTCRAVRDGDRWLLTGEKPVVPSYADADGVVVSATGPDGPGLWVVEQRALASVVETTTKDHAATLTFDATPAELLGGADALERTLLWAAVALAAVQVGVADGAIALTASYVSGREQFGRPLGTFQSVQHQLADCSIEADAMRVTLWQALAELEPRAVQVARWWCDQAGLDIVHRTQHLHGGIGVDVDYPLHRYFLWGKQLAGTLAGAEAALSDLGDLLAAEPPTS
ncbi:acyl-CoA dehydrogenase family protein [Nocardioides speluncae]|uniref:acyl-CoA dehydrogenase family protein n=1 Tax=Nocardioides speluncae TaxID=2670337 RepID=UPI000D687A47|nr:acyl-CoA dehydrogenase family protein [Nocardioides speluncae]